MLIKSIFIITAILFSEVLLGQNTKKLSLLGCFQVNQVIYDKVNPDNKPTGFGYGIQLKYVNPSKFEPLIELGWDRIQKYVEFEGMKITKSQCFNFFIGTDFEIFSGLKFEFILGASFVDSYACWGFKPAIAYNFGKNERFFGKVSLTHTLPKYGGNIEPFGYLNLGIGIKVF
jgi:hypothetical protein